jgi:type IV pilus assembly protein PilY1
MLGETTATGSSNYQGYFLLTGGNAGYYAICRQWSGTHVLLGMDLLSKWLHTEWIYSGYYRDSKWICGRYIGEKIDRGFAKSVTTSKSGAKYISPLSTTNTQCDGQGIYF